MTSFIRRGPGYMGGGVFWDTPKGTEKWLLYVDSGYGLVMVLIRHNKNIPRIAQIKKRVGRINTASGCKIRVAADAEILPITKAFGPKFDCLAKGIVFKVSLDAPMPSDIWNMGGHFVMDIDETLHDVY